MPRRVQPLSLREASIMCIVSNFEDYWCAGKSSTLLEDSRQSEVFTPFQYLRDDMIDEIIDMLDRRDLLRSYHYQLLLHSNIKRLKLKESLSYDVKKAVIKTLGSRCQSMTHLDIHLLYEGYLEEQCTLFANLPQLISLDISVDEKNSEVLKVISENCPNLLDINMHVCSMDASCDTVLLYLCNSTTHPKNLPKLRNLSIYGYAKKPSVHTVVHLLNSQPSLQYLSIPGIDYAFDQMYGGEFHSLKEVPPEWIHNLLDITVFGNFGWVFKLSGISGGEYIPILSTVDRLNLTFQCCPFLTKLCLIELGEPKFLNNLSKLKHLTKLSVQISEKIQPPLPYESRQFSTHMSSVLTEIGHNLISLECEGFVEVRLITIGKLCPELESLTLNHTGFRFEHDLMQDYVNNPFPCFKNLTVIDISSMELDHEAVLSVGEEEISLLFKNATEITKIHMYYVKTLTDNVISASNKIHSFRHLKKCRLYRCSPISVESVWKLLSADNPLDNLFVRGCENITPNDMDLVKREAKLRQFNVNFTL